MNRLLYISLLILAGCTKPEPEYCWECRYHDRTYEFCDMTRQQIDSLRDVFGYDCENDLLICTIKSIEP